MPTNRNSALLLTLLLAFSYGCKKEEAPAPPPPAPAAPKPAPAPATPAPVQQQLSSAAKVGSAVVFKKDPFKPVIVPQAPAAPAAGQAARPAGPATADMLPIQSFEVNKFKVAGIIAGLRENKALVVDPTGKGYVVQVGMQIGNANGRVSRITASTVEVVEKSGRKSRTIVLTLAKKR